MNRFFLSSIISLLTILCPFSLMAFQPGHRPGNPGSAIPLTPILHETTPSELNIDSLALYRGVEEILKEALDSGAFPGVQVLLAKEGNVFYHESFGYHTYDSLINVKNDDIYDLASITKVTAATLALMKLYDQGDFDLDQTMGHYFPFLMKSNKRDLKMREVLAHQARLKSWIP